MTAQQFIDKFSVIPEDQWSDEAFDRRGRKDAYGHCGVDRTGRDTKESKALRELFKKQFSDDVHVIGLNDGYNKTFCQPDCSKINPPIHSGRCTPKRRMLAALDKCL